MHMKKLTGFLAAALMIVVGSASAQQSRVILHSNTNYEVQIDGHAYNRVGTSTINDLSAGSHTVSVYQVISKGIFGIGKKRNQLSFERFNLYNNDVNIAVDQNGQIRIYENNYNGKSNRHRDDDYSNGKYGKSEGKGNGHKYGHYKNKHNKGNQKHEHDDDYDNDHDESRNDHRGDK
jgi:hypothetical protein